MYKIFILKISVVCVFACYVSAQSDFVIDINDADFSFYKTSIVKYQGTNNTEKLREIMEVENVSRVDFLKNDSLRIVDAGINSFGTTLKSICKVTVRTRNVIPAAFIVPGVIVGGLAGWFIGYGVGGLLISSEDIKGGSDFTERFGACFLGSLLGAVAGGIGSAILVNAINYETLDLFSVSEKNKKNKLIKFLRQNKK